MSRASWKYAFHEIFNEFKASFKNVLWTKKNEKCFFFKYLVPELTLILYNNKMHVIQYACYKMRYKFEGINYYSLIFSFLFSTIKAKARR